MKILLISHRFHPDFGGIETISELLAERFVQRRHEIRVLTWTENAGNKTFPFTVIRKPGFLRVIQQIFWADIIFENNPTLRLSWPLAVIRKPCVISVQTWISRISGKISLLDKVKLFRIRHTSNVIACSDAVKRRGLPSAIVIGNPYNEQLFRITNTSPRQSDFIFVGRLVSDKGVDLAIKAIQIIQEASFKLNEPVASLTIVGDGPEKENLIELCKILRVKNVEFTGKLTGEELVNCMNKHKYALVPSVWEEPFGIVALEVMACGCLPIVSDGGGLPDAVGKAGLVFKRNNIDDLVATIRTLLNNLELEGDIRSRFQAHLLAHRSNYVADKYLEVMFDAYNVTRTN